MNQNDFEQEKQYVWHDGVRISDEQLVTLAKNAGSYAIAEHYLLSLLAHGTMYGLTYYINKVNEVREHYGVIPIPTPKQDDDQGCRKTCYTPQSIEDQARKKYRAMSPEQRVALLKDCLMLLIINYPSLFKFKNQWQGIYLVVRDRLDNGLSQSDFLCFARSAIPEHWPQKLVIAESVFKNIRRDLQSNDDDEAYYEMDYNPYGLLCDTFWEILKQQI